MREDTWQKRLQEWKRRHAIPQGRVSGDPIHPAWALEELKKRIRVRISWMSGGGTEFFLDDTRKGGTYHASRYYQINVNPDEPLSKVYDEKNTMVVEITMMDLHRALEGLYGGGFPAGNMYAEELWFRHGGA